MNASTLRYARYRFPPEIIGHAVWLYHRFCLSFRDAEDLLAQRGITVSYETIRQWCQTFGPEYARRLRTRATLLVVLRPRVFLDSGLRESARRRSVEMRKHVEESVATGVAAGRGRGGRFSAGRKREVVMRLLRGEDLESVSRISVR